MNTNSLISYMDGFDYAQSGETLMPGKYVLTLLGFAVRDWRNWIRATDGCPISSPSSHRLLEQVWLVNKSTDTDQPINSTNNIIRSRPMTLKIKYRAHPFMQYFDKLTTNSEPNEVLQNLISNDNITMQILANVGTFRSTRVNYSIICDVLKARLATLDPATKANYNLALIERGPTIISQTLKW